MFQWLVFVWLCLQLGKEFGLPARVTQIVQGTLLLLMLLALLGVLGGARLAD